MRKAGNTNSGVGEAQEGGANSGVREAQAGDQKEGATIQAGDRKERDMQLKGGGYELGRQRT